MVILEATDLQIYVKERLLVEAKKLQVNNQDRIGLVGKNGCGKTTLLQVLAGLKAPDSGFVTRHRDCHLIPQLKRMDTMKSGGEVTQAYLQEAFTREPAILLADEPTTHLDAAHIEWLEKKLRHWPGALLIVSHDRAFLDALCTTIWEMENGRIQTYAGNYSFYAAQKERQQQQQQQAYEEYEKKRKQLEEAMREKEQKAERATKIPKKVNPSEAKLTGAKPYFAKKQKKLQKSVKAMETRLEQLPKVEKPKQHTPIKMSLPNEEAFRGRIVLRAENLPGTVGSRQLWKAASFHISGGDKLAIIGPNGSGKTTLLRKIIHGDEHISRSPAMKIGYFSQDLSVLKPDQTILENVSSTSNQEESLIRTVLARLHFFREDVYKPVDVLSGGERVKVALAKLFVSDINTLILDEPTNFLDLESVEALESLLQEYTGTVIFASHDRRMIERVATSILAIKEGQIQLFSGTYRQYLEYAPQSKRDERDDQLLLLETRISEVLSRLSVEPSEELEEEFRQLVAAKRRLQPASKRERS